MDFFHWIIGILMANSLAQGGLVLAVTGGLMYEVRNLPNRLYNWIIYFTSIEVSLSNEDELYEYFKQWIDKHPYSKRTRRLRANLTHDKIDEDEYGYARETKARITYTPDQGSHFFFYRHRLVWMSNERNPGVPRSSSPASLPGTQVKDKVLVNVRIFTQNKQLVRDFVEECRLMQEQSKKNMVSIYTNGSYSWNRVTSKEPRGLESVVLKDGQLEHLVSDIEKFQASSERYKLMGIPYRRGYLLYGDPGSGKSSLAMAVAGHLRTNIYQVSLADPDLSDQKLIELLISVKNHSVILFEDIDAAFVKRERAGSVIKGITFSGLLNALDGVAAKEGCIFFMSTNHRDKLDPALIRPGRADLQMELGNADRSQIERLYLRFFPERHDEARTFANSCPENTISMAALQDLFIEVWDEPRGPELSRISSLTTKVGDKYDGTREKIKGKGKGKKANGKGRIYSAGEFLEKLDSSDTDVSTQGKVINLKQNESFTKLPANKQRKLIKALQKHGAKVVCK